MRNWTHDISAAFARAGHDADIDIDIVEELAQHAGAAYETARAEGASAADAEADVRRQIAVWTREASALKRRRRRIGAPAPPPATATRRTAGVMQDVRYALRMLHRQWPFSLLVIGTMAAGITATTLLFSVTYGVLLKPLPWPEADRLVRIEERRERATRTMAGILTNGPYLAWSEAPATVEGLAAYRAQTVTMTGSGDSERVRVTSTTASLFPLLRASPERGSIFASADEGRTVAVISHGLWLRRFGAREDVVGRAIGFDGVSHTIVGIMPRDFVYPDRETDAWVPFRIRPTTTPDGGSWIQIFSAIARLKPGVTPAQAADEATARARATDGGMAAMAVFGTKGRPQITVTPVLDALTADVRDALTVLLAAVALLLMTAIANIASVQLARASTRRKEMAVRAAIGAGTSRLARQVIIETLVVGAAGGVLGWVMALALHTTLPALLPAGFPRVDDIRLDWRVSVFALTLAVFASVAAGLAPALQARRLNLVEGLVEQASASGRAAGRSRVARIRALIMTGQVAVACVLLAGASLLTRTFVAMLRADRGFVSSNVLTAQLATPGGLFTANQRAQLVTRALEQLRAREGVAAAGIATSVPLLPADAVMAFTMPPAPGQDRQVQVQCSYRMISPGYLEAMGIKVVEGRALNDRDTSTSAPVILVNRAFANRYLGPNAIGRRIPARLADGKPDWEIAGVIQDVKMHPDLVEAAQPEILVSYLQFRGGLDSDPVFVVRTHRDPVSMIDTLRHVVRQEAPTATLESVMTMEDRVMGSLAHPRLYAVLLTAFGAFALLIAGVGLFGVLSYNVAQRTKELGIRAALGATPGAMVRMVLAEGLAISSIGACVGIGASLAAGRWLSAFLYGVKTFDPATLVAVPAALLLVAAAACLAPALRASRIDPLRVLKGGG
jgi:putative ABC transport system permease protein